MRRQWQRLTGGLAALFARGRSERELDAELQQFLEAAIEAKMRGGATREAATRAARLELGSAAAVKDHVRDAGWETSIESIWQDLRYGARSLRRAPAFAAIAVLLLATGVGANTAIFSLLNAVMLRPLPVHDPGQLVEPLSRYPGEPRMNGFSWDFYEHVRDHNTVFSGLTGLAPARIELRAGTVNETVDGEYVVGTYFPVLGVAARIGRLIDAGDARPGAPPVVVLSSRYWASRFNEDPSILGTGLKVNGAVATVIGVAPREFTGLRPGVMPALWIPATRPMSVGLIARLKPGLPIDRARAEMRVLHRWRVERIAEASHDPRWLQADLDLVPAAAGLSAVRDRFATPLLVLMAAVATLLLLVCINVASLLLARGAARRQEIAIRVSLGGARLRLARQVMTESLLLSVAGSVLGVMAGTSAANTLVRVMMSGRLPPGWPARLDLDLTPDVRVLLFSAAAALITTLIFGLAPAWSAFTSPPVTSLREQGSAGDSKARRFSAQGLVVAQVALSIVLLSAAGIFANHLSMLRNDDLGFQRHGVLLVSLNPQGSGLDRGQLHRLYRELLDRLHALPGVRSATLSAVTPIQGGAASRFASVEGYEEKPDARSRVSLNWVAPRYFETFGTPILAGRDFRPGDAAGVPVAIVNQAMARHYFGDVNPVGRRLSLERESQPFEIVAVVADAKYSDLHEPAPRTVYLNALQGTIPSHFAIRAALPPSSLVTQVRRTMESVVPSVPIARVTTLDDQMDESLVIERLITGLSVLFGVMGAVLAGLALYALLASGVARRTREIGLRMALGARERDVISMVVTSAAGLVVAGIVVGTPLAWWTRRIAARLVVNLAAGPVWPIVSAAAALFVIALLAAYVPAHRAARVQPVDALRH